MNLDSTSIATILRVNGLTPQSPIDQINALLLKAGYSSDEIQNALAKLTGVAVSPPVAGSVAPAQPIAQYSAQPMPASEQPVPGTPMPPTPPTYSAPVASVNPQLPPTIPANSAPTAQGKKFLRRHVSGPHWSGRILESASFADWSHYLTYVISILIIVLVALVVLGGGLFSHGNTSILIELLTAFAGFAAVFSIVYGIFSLIIAVLACLLSLGLAIRRLHDLGVTAWILPIVWVVTIGIELSAKHGPGAFDFAPWVWVGVAISVIFSLALLFWPGKPTSNKFGEVIKYRSAWAALVGNKNPPDPSKKSHHGLLVTLIVLALLILVALGGAGYYFLTKLNSSPTVIPFPTSTTGALPTPTNPTSPQPTLNPSLPVVNSTPAGG